MVEKEPNPFENLTEFAAAMNKDAKYRWAGYELSVAHAASLEPHIFGSIPSDLIDIARPNEPDEIKTYRKKIWQSVTKTRFEKIYTVFKRVFTPHNYTIEYKERPSGVTDLNTPEKYFTKEFTETGSVLNYMKDILFRMALGDPGAVIAMYDIIPTENGQYSRPKPVLYESERVWWYVPNEIIVLQAYDKSKLEQDREGEKTGLILIAITPEQTIQLEQIGKKDENRFTAFVRETRETPYMPARMLKGISTVTEDGEIWQQSFVAGIVPDWNKAINLITDLDGYTVIHLYPKYVQIDIPCNTCNGDKKVLIGANGEKGNCSSCNGTGIQAGGTGPFSSLMIPRDQVGKISIDEIAGYVEAPQSIIETAMKMIDAHIDAGFRALNMEVVGVSQANTSAEKVALDRQDLNQTLTDVMLWAFDFLQWIFFTAGSIRYGAIVKDIAADVVPEIQKPVSFDYSTVDSIIQELKAAEEAKLPSAIVAELQKRSIGILWGNDNVTSKKLMAIMELDPLPGITPDGVLALQSTMTTESIDFFIHFRIAELVEIAIEEDMTFLDLKMSEKRAKILELALQRIAKTPPPVPDPVT